MIRALALLLPRASNALLAASLLTFLVWLPVSLALLAGGLVLAFAEPLVARPDPLLRCAE